jgi:hypothetical protein
MFRKTRVLVVSLTIRLTLPRPSAVLGARTMCSAEPSFLVEKISFYHFLSEIDSDWMKTDQSELEVSRGRIRVVLTSINIRHAILKNASYENQAILFRCLFDSADVLS